MRILITGVSMPFPMELVQRLGVEHDVRCTDRNDVQAEDFVRSELGHDDTTSALVHGMDAIVHCGMPDPTLTSQKQLDSATRQTYNLLFAASEATVPRVVFLSSLVLMNQYEADFLVTETWKPRPTTEIDQLSYHLGEFTCKEFVRENRLTAICLRLGELYRGEDEPPNIWGLHLDDAVQAIELALIWDVARERTSGGRPPAPNAQGWGLFHIQSSIHRARFPTRSAQGLMDFKPRQIH